MFIKVKSGLILINKPPGPTSHDIVDALRKITGERRIGHAGTLDPFAEGLLICLIGREATRLSDSFRALDKEYEAVIKFGQETDSYDITGKIVADQPEKIDLALLKRDLPRVLKTFLGKQEQLPPMYSAKKVHGQKLYELARQGKEIARKKQHVEIKGLELFDFKAEDYPSVKIKVNCSSGTYIRTLAYDLGRKLGTGAFLAKLKRTSIGQYWLKDAEGIEKLTSKNYPRFLRDVPD